MRWCGKRSRFEGGSASSCSRQMIARAAAGFHFRLKMRLRAQRCLLCLFYEQAMLNAAPARGVAAALRSENQSVAMAQSLKQERVQWEILMRKVSLFRVAAPIAAG